MFSFRFCTCHPSLCKITDAGIWRLVLSKKKWSSGSNQSYLCLTRWRCEHYTHISPVHLSTWQTVVPAQVTLPGSHHEPDAPHKLGWGGILYSTLSSPAQFTWMWEKICNYSAEDVIAGMLLQAKMFVEISQYPCPFLHAGDTKD